MGDNCLIDPEQGCKALAWHAERVDLSHAQLQRIPGGCWLETNQCWWAVVELSLF